MNSRRSSLWRIDVGKLMGSLKGFTAREANRLPGGTGTPFWQKESYDHWVRNEEEFRRIARCIENKPGLVLTAEAYRRSSAYERSGGAPSGDAARLGALVQSSAVQGAPRGIAGAAKLLTSAVTG
jgi:hypothetical protein